MKKHRKGPAHTRVKTWIRLPADAELHVDPEALRRARQGVPKGDLHR